MIPDITTLKLDVALRWDNKLRNYFLCFKKDKPQV